VSIMPQDPDSKLDPHEPCACGHDETDHGYVAGCIHCGNCDRYIPRSTYEPQRVDQRVLIADELGRHAPLWGDRDFPGVWISWCKCGWEADPISKELGRADADAERGKSYRLHVADDLLSLLGDA
jgi:hypothetical protein